VTVDYLSARAPSADSTNYAEQTTAAGVKIVVLMNELIFV